MGAAAGAPGRVRGHADRASVSGGPMVVIVDDLPWLDRASAAVLGFVARRVRGAQIGFLATARTADLGFFERAGLREVELGPLDEHASGEFMQERFPTPRRGGPGERDTDALTPQGLEIATHSRRPG